MEFELPDRVKAVPKNILLGSLATQHQAVFAMRRLFSKKRQISWIKLLYLSVYHVK